MDNMQHNNHKLGSRINEWESSQTGLPEGSEAIWAELERVLESGAGQKRKPLPVQWMAAASLILLFATGIYWYRLSLKNQLSPTAVVPAQTQPLMTKPKVLSRKPLSADAQPISRQKTLAKSGSIELVSSITPPSSSQVPATVNPEVVAVAVIPKADEKIEIGTINSPLPDVRIPSNNRIEQSVEVNYWRKNRVIKKTANGMPVVHAFDENRSSVMSVQLLLEERPLPNFEAPPPNDNKPRWKITLQTTNHPNTTGIKE
jgi:hypothetical protein